MWDWIRQHAVLAGVAALGASYELALYLWKAVL